MTSAVTPQHTVEHTDRHADSNSAAVLPLSHHRRLTALRSAPPHSVSLRDGELVVYRRSRSLLYQCRYKLADGTWVRQTTGKAALEHVVGLA
jgi:hypothetical protein